MIPDHEGSLSPFQNEFSGSQDPAVMIAENGQNDLVSQSLLGGVPLDIEIGRVPAGSPVFERVPPPGVVLSRDRHVIGNNIEHLAEPIFSKFPAKRGVRLLAAQFGIDAMIIYDVVAMRASGSGLEVRGAVHMRNPQIPQIIRNSGGRIETKTAVELQPIGGTRDAHLLELKFRRVF